MGSKKVVKYNFKKIVETLLILRDVGYDMALAANNSNVPIIMVTAWAEEFGEEIWGAHPIIIQDPKAKLMNQMSRQHESVRFKAESLTERLLDIMIDRVMDNTKAEEFSLKELTGVFKEVVPYILPKFVDDNKIKDTTMEETYDVFIEKMFEKLNDNENRKIDAKGSAKKLSGRS